MRLSDFDFDLPEEAIALRPARPRDKARLLHVTPQAGKAFHDKSVSDLTGLLEPGDALVFNNTRVIAAGLTGVRERDGVRANISLNLHRRVDANRWRAFARPAKRLAAGDSDNPATLQPIYLRRPPITQPKTPAYRVTLDKVKTNGSDA